jgi:hypothetical protein
MPSSQRSARTRYESPDIIIFVSDEEESDPDLEVKLVGTQRLFTGRSGAGVSKEAQLELGSKGNPIVLEPQTAGASRENAIYIGHSDEELV